MECSAINGTSTSHPCQKGLRNMVEEGVGKRKSQRLGRIGVVQCFLAKIKAVYIPGWLGAGAQQPHP